MKFNTKNRYKGFTLLELMITLLIVAILTIIAVTSYNYFIKQSRLNGAEADLVNMSTVMSSYYQQQLSYPAVTTTTAATQTALSGWLPTQSSYFTYIISASPGTTYTLQATGISGTQMAGYTVTITNANVRGGTMPGGAAISW
jgi:type IV pilus assembly protein PilE